MIIGTGIDIVELSRIEGAIQRQQRFIKRILTEAEQQDYYKLNKKRRLEFAAGRFAAKEAFVKAIGTGISSSFGWQDIQVIKSPSGKPYLTADGCIDQIHLSISHSTAYAVASVIIERSSS